jgi:hypothetical protein
MTKDNEYKIPTLGGTMFYASILPRSRTLMKSFVDSDKNFSKEYPSLQKALDDELHRVTRQYGGEKPEDLAKFPDVKPAGTFY